MISKICIRRDIDFSSIFTVKSLIYTNKYVSKTIFNGAFKIIIVIFLIYYMPTYNGVERSIQKKYFFVQTNRSDE